MPRALLRGRREGHAAHRSRGPAARARGAVRADGRRCRARVCARSACAAPAVTSRVPSRC